MASLTMGQSRLIAGGARAFTGVRPRAVKAVRNGCTVFMRRKDSYMVEVRAAAGYRATSRPLGGRYPIRQIRQVNLGEEEPEDIAVRRFMKAVQESKVIEQVRNRSATRPLL